jgi:transcription antitermination factor NusG
MRVTEPNLYKIGDIVGFIPAEEPVDLTPDPQGVYFWLQTEPGREMTAQTNLIMRKVPFYLPTILRAARLPAHRHIAREDHPDVAMPLFPRAIFVSGKVLGAKERCIRSTPGMLANPFVRFGDEFAVLNPLAMQTIQYIEAGERELYLRKKKRPKNLPIYIPQIGEEVSFLVEEVMGGKRGIVSEVDDDGRISILMDIMKRTVRVRTTADRIEPVEADPAAKTAR